MVPSMNCLPSPQSFLRLTIAMRALILVAFSLSLFATAPAVHAKDGLNYANYDVPLYQQIVNRIRAQVSARLQGGRLTQDRFFIIPFAYENDGNDPEFSHSFITVIRVFAEGKRPRPNSEFKTGTYKGWNFEAYNISWLPADFMENPHLCVFNGVGSRLFARRNQCPISPGRNFNLEDTIKLAVNAKVAVGMWGPYEITQAGFDRGVKRKQLLDSGAIKYRADDRLYQKNKIASNCFHAMASLDELFPRGGVFGTGFKMWGLNGTSRVLIEYNARAKAKGLLLEQIDVKGDRYGFVYAPQPDARRGVYDPFKVASAYHR
jgi:hypothetical protein